MTDRIPPNEQRKRWLTWSVPAAVVIIVVGFAVLVPRGVSAPVTAPPKTPPAQTTSAPVPSPAPPATSAPAAASSTASSASATSGTPAISEPAVAGATTPNPTGDTPKELAPGILVPPGRTVTYIRGQGPPATDKPGKSLSLKPAPVDQMTRQREQLFRETHGGLDPQKPPDATAPRDPNTIEIGSTDPAVAWRIRNGDVERSPDRGKSWAPVPTGRRGAIVAGDSPSRSLCWVAGRGGLVMRTIDAGTWDTLSFPEKTDLKAIAALDARVAIVTTADGREFRTNDGGLTWRR
jgi:hypothetical protein